MGTECYQINTLLQNVFNTTRLLLSELDGTFLRENWKNEETNDIGCRGLSGTFD